MSRLALLLAAGMACLGCGRENLDLLLPTSSKDPCLDFTSQSECDEHAPLGCSFQPNLEGCSSQDADCRPGQCSGGDPFVRRVERGFLLNGKSFRFVGVSSWALFQPTRCTTGDPDERQAWLQSAFDDLVPANVKVARAFAFQNTAGPNGDDFTNLDLVVQYARRAGVRLVFVLEHAGGSCSEGGRRNPAWYTTGYLDPDGMYKLAYRDYARSVAERYREEPTVLGYVLVQGTGSGAEPSDVASFVSDMGQLLHGTAPSQLISIDADWLHDSDPEGENFRMLQSLPVVDYVDVDDYFYDETAEVLSEPLRGVLEGLGKPAVIGEGAFMLSGRDDAALRARAQQASARTKAWRDAGFAGALFWAYQPGWGEVSEEFDARPGDPMLAPGGVVDLASF